MKNWILKLRFVQDAFVKEREEQLAQERPKIFALAQKDILETMADDLEKRANELVLYKLETLLSVVNEKHIISQKGKSIYIGGELADAGTLHNLRSEVEFLEASELWKILNETPKELAHRAMFVDDGKLENQLLKGRAILYMLATQQKILNTIKSLSTAGGLQE